LKTLLSGNQALARGAWEAGVRVAAGYPGTPSTEILENLAPMSGVYAEWCPNEKVALDVAAGAAYAGTRAMAVMKHVGVNVAADALFYASMTGIQAGLVIIVADDPGMHSSQGEQDTRRYAKFARLPCLEPSDTQEAKDMIAVALDLSERFDTPVIVRVTTRISHSYGVVDLDPEAQGPTWPDDSPAYHIDTTKYVMVPGNARRRHPVMEQRVDEIAAYANEFPVNRVEMAKCPALEKVPGTSLGVVTHGVAYQYAREVLPEASFLRLGMTYPVPRQMVADFAAKVDRLLVIEELDPVIEEELRLAGIDCEGKQFFPLVGELSPDAVREGAVAAGVLEEAETSSMAPNADLSALPPRPPVLCPGCPHRGVFAVTRKLKLVVNGDIGCYTLGFLPPLAALHSCGCMGASIGVAHGVSKAGVQQKNVAVIGDSTFFHTGIPALLNIAYNKGTATTIILDNRTTAMTGHQQHPGTGYTLQEEPTIAVDLPALIRGLGIEHVHVVDPYDLQAVEETLRACVERDEPSVVIAQRECALLPAARSRYQALTVDLEACIACGLCRQLGCAALFKGEQIERAGGRIAYKTAIDPLLCTGCEICAQICPRSAISFRTADTEEVQA
jgi:indolepyruvate ferredoxin oxidoreductase, alpha subunit